MNHCQFQKELDTIIIQGDSNTLVDTAMKIAGQMVKRDHKNNPKDSESVSTSQIRNIYGSSKRIEMALDEKNMQEMYQKLILLKPKMAYANGRFNKDLGNGRHKIPGFKILVDSLSYAIDQIDGDYHRMKNFFNFFEAILAYHKAEGGK